MVSAELLLDAFGRRLARRDNDAGVIDKDIELVGQGRNIGSGLANGLL
jgi:hypothetical protein